MKPRWIVLLALGSTSACAWLFAACGGDTATNDAGPDATSNDVATNDSPVTDTGNGNDTGPNPDGAPKPDGGCATGPGCAQCCAMAYPDAAAFFTATEETCACTTPGDCKNVCNNTLCTGKQPGNNSPCEMCVQNPDAGGCREKAATACLGDTSCAALATCIAACGTPPSDAGGGG